MATGWKTRQKVAKAMRNRENFRIGNISGGWIKEHQTPEFGQLPALERDQLKFHLSEKDVYVVYSYRTPIAWAYCQEWTIPNVNYSVTTTHHQNVIKVAILPNSPYL